MRILPPLALPAAIARHLIAPVGAQAGNITDVTAVATRRLYALYCGRAEAALQSIEFVTNVTTAYVSAGISPYAEIALCTGEYTYPGGAFITRRGFLDVAAIYNSTGNKNNTIALTGVRPGDGLWMVHGCRTTGTLFQLRGMLADPIGIGYFQSAAITQPSTMAADTPLGFEGSAPGWVNGYAIY